MDEYGTSAAPAVSKRAAAPLLLALLAATGIGGCDFLDPTQVDNPRATEEDILGAEEPVRTLLAGLRAQFARMVGSQVVISEVTSDNYSIHGTGISGVWDDPRTILPTDVNTTGTTQGIYWNTQELKALANFVLDRIAPRDETATDEELAEVHYRRGMAFVTQAENFTHVPTEQDGPAVPASQLFQLGIEDLERGLALAPDGSFALPARAALARAHRGLGGAEQAVARAQQVLAADPQLEFLQLFDGTTLNNAPHVFLVIRALKEMQPLPRLDFLDPKYLRRDSGIPVAKAEEMHLILAEAALARDALAEARAHLADAVDLARSRGTTTFIDDDERLNADLTIRPRSSEILVAADPDSPLRAGLILDRPGTAIPVPEISSTSLDADSVMSLTDEDEIWHAFHLARQEIMVLEGRRMSDLGIRLPMMQREIDLNPSIEEGGPGTVVVVPEYIPPTDQMDRFDPPSPHDPAGNVIETEVVIRFDMNRILAENRVNAFGG